MKNKFKAGDKVRVKGTKSILTIKEPLYSDNETYYFVKERECAILEGQLITVIKKQNTQIDRDVLFQLSII